MLVFHGVKGTRRVDVVYEGEMKLVLPLLAVEFGSGMDSIFLLVIWDKTLFSKVGTHLVVGILILTLWLVFN